MFTDRGKSAAQKKDRGDQGSVKEGGRGKFTEPKNGGTKRAGEKEPRATEEGGNCVTAKTWSTPRKGREGGVQNWAARIEWGRIKGTDPHTWGGSPTKEGLGEKKNAGKQPWGITRKMREDGTTKKAASEGCVPSKLKSEDLGGEQDPSETSWSWAGRNIRKEGWGGSNDKTPPRIALKRQRTGVST